MSWDWSLEYDISHPANINMSAGNCAAMIIALGVEREARDNGSDGAYSVFPSVKLFLALDNDDKRRLVTQKAIKNGYAKQHENSQINFSLVLERVFQLYNLVLIACSSKQGVRCD